MEHFPCRLLEVHVDVRLRRKLRLVVLEEEFEQADFVEVEDGLVEFVEVLLDALAAVRSVFPVPDLQLVRLDRDQ